MIKNKNHAKNNQYTIQMMKINEQESQKEKKRVVTGEEDWCQRAGERDMAVFYFCESSS